MKSVLVVLRDPNGVENTASLPLDEPLRRWLPPLVRKIGLESDVSKNDHEVIEVLHVSSGKRIKQDDTLASLGVVSEDILELHLTVPESQPTEASESPKDRSVAQPSVKRTNSSALKQYQPDSSPWDMLNDVDD